MVEYRAQLDKERDEALAKGRNRPKRKVGVGALPNLVEKYTHVCSRKVGGVDG